MTMQFTNPHLLPKIEHKRISGVYFLYNDRDEIVYIGASINILSRVDNHLQNDGNKWKENRITRYNYIEAPLEDLPILEYQYIKKYMPLFNSDILHLARYKIRTA